MPMVPYASFLRIVAGEHKLHGAGKPGIEFRALVRQILANAVTNAHRLFLSSSTAIAMPSRKHHIRPSLVRPERHLLGQRKIIALWLRPVHQVHCLRRLARLHLHRHTVAQQLIHGLVVAVETSIVVARPARSRRQRRADLRCSVPSARKVAGRQCLFDAAVVGTVSPVAEVAIAKVCHKQLDDTILRSTFWLDRSASRSPVTPRSRPDNVDRISRRWARVQRSCAASLRSPPDRCPHFDGGTSRRLPCIASS